MTNFWPRDIEHIARVVSEQAEPLGLEVIYHEYGSDGDHRILILADGRPHARLWFRRNVAPLVTQVTADCPEAVGEAWRRADALLGGVLDAHYSEKPLRRHAVAGYERA